MENEFGAVNLDSALLEADASVSVTELSNGCLCCSVRGEFSAALSDLLAQRRAGRLQFEHIIIESTGLADPAPIVQTFFVEPALRDALRLDAVIALADCQHLTRQLDEHPVAAAQLGFADRILLTKADRVDDTQREAVIARIRRINSRAGLYTVEHGICPAALWLDLHAFTLSDDLSLSRGLHIVTAHAAAAPRFQPFRTAVAPATAVDDAIQAHLLEGESWISSASAPLWSGVSNATATICCAIKGYWLLPNNLAARWFRVFIGWSALTMAPLGHPANRAVLSW